jgi:hypothetical protein
MNPEIESAKSYRDYQCASRRDDEELLPAPVDE